jgi:Zn-dependent metalloprotease
MHTCSCQFVPPFVLDGLKASKDSAVAGRVQASQKESEQLRKRRASGRRTAKKAKGNAAQSLSAVSVAAATAPPAGTGGREVYDCGQQWVQRVSLARGEGDPATVDSDVNYAYRFAGDVRDVYLDRFERASIDNLDMNLVLNVHYGTNFMNAFWDGDEMTFGDGDGVIFSSFAASLDVVAHELTHGVVQNTANLIYQDQPGALNEHFADVFGTVITYFVDGKTNWLIGDEIMGSQLYGEALRSMKAPGTAYDNPYFGKDPQPDHMSNIYTGGADNGGVHINSGILNKAFYLAATDLGVDVAAGIWYRSLQLLWSNAQFADAAAMMAESARAHTKAGLAPTGSAQSVRSAFRAVGL